MESIIANDRELATARENLRHIDSALSPAKVFELTKTGISPALIERHHVMLRQRRAKLSSAVEAYEALKAGNGELLRNWRRDPGTALIFARILRGLTQKELAAHLGLREQQIQRYEADRYRGINLTSFKRFSQVLGLRIVIDAGDSADFNLDLSLKSEEKIEPREMRQVFNYVKKMGWLPAQYQDTSADDGREILAGYVAQVRDRFGRPALLRTGLNALDYSKDLSLLVWQARVSQIARAQIAQLAKPFNPIDVSWLRDLVKLSAANDLENSIQQELNKHGICFVVEAALPGLSLDGAAFMDNDVPVVALTVRHDRIDNFWFTLLHELGHIFLHMEVGIGNSFFDDTEEGQAVGKKSVDELENDANEFAGSAIVPPELWEISPAAGSVSKPPLEKMAMQLGIHPALLFGKARRERENYKIFADSLGQGTVRKQFKPVDGEIQVGRQ